MIESVGTAKVIYTVEPHPENERMAVVTYWLENGVRIGQMDVMRGERSPEGIQGRTTAQAEE